MKSSAVCVGDNCIDYYLPPINRDFIGGNALNVAVHMQTCGISTAYVGVVGNDADGQHILSVLAQKGLEISNLNTLPGKTAQTHIRLSPQGDRQFVYEYLGPQESLIFDDDALQFILGHRLIHTTQNGGVHLYLPHFRQSRQALVSFDFGERPAPDLIERTIGSVDVAFFSLPEYLNDQAESLAREMFSRGPALVVVTLGAKGSLAFDGNIYFESTPPIDTVDTLGAGDCYIGVFIANWLQQKTVSTCMQVATHSAAKVCQHYGAWPQVRIFPD